jgi:hypothetical protein
MLKDFLHTVILSATIVCLIASGTYIGILMAYIIISR